MKVNLTSLFLILSSGLFAQLKTTIDLPIDSATQKVVFTDVVKVDSMKKEKIFDLLRTWSSSTSDIKEKNIKIADVVTGEITLECKDPIPSFCFIKYTLILYIKENKYKYIIRNFSHEGCIRENMSTAKELKSFGEIEQYLNVEKDRYYYDNILQGAKDQSNKIIESLKKYLSVSKNEKDF
jgi:Domain of unknown function (DUF4468) with TBP-like fold